MYIYVTTIVHCVGGGRNEYLCFQKITKLEYKVPEGFPDNARDIVEKLLVSICSSVLCLAVCVCVYMHVCVCLCVHACVCLCVHACVCLCVHECALA